MEVSVVRYPRHESRSSGETIDRRVEYSSEIIFHDGSESRGRYRKVFPAIRSDRAYRRCKRQQLVGHRVTEATSAGCQERRLEAVYTRFLGIPAAFIGRRIDDQSLFTSGCRHAAVTRHRDYFQSADARARQRENKRSLGIRNVCAAHRLKPV